MKCRCLVTLAMMAWGLLSLTTYADAADALELKKGDHITLMGNTLPERMQHDGWLEALIQARFPDHELVFRNIAYSADGIDQAERLRVAGFGSPEDWLNRTKADVIFAFFGFSESFQGDEGLEAFKSKLANFIKTHQGKNYSGKGAPRIVLFTPIAAENIKNVNYPDASANNARLKKYSDAVIEVAKSAGVPYVDLYKPTLAAFAAAKNPLTINGVHLTSNGNRVVADAIANALFASAKSSLGDDQLEKLRLAVTEKNGPWFHRYQTTDGFNVHGGRSHKKYGKDSNRVVMDREMEILEAMAANRDKRVWAAAKGSDLKVDDSNLPKHIPVGTNKPGKGPGGTHIYPSGEEAIKDMTVHNGMKVTLFASEKDFPELVNPVQMAFDTKGRLWVIAWHSYPHYKPGEGMRDKLLILEDTDNDGKADKCKTFAENLNSPTGFEFWNNGVLLAEAPHLVFLQDTDGDDQADEKTTILSGISSGDTHHTANSFVISPGGALHFGEGTFHRTQVETPYGTLRNRDGCHWRYEPRTGKLTRYMPMSFANPHGHVIDRWGQSFLHDGTGAVPYHSNVFSSHREYPAKCARGPVLYNKRTRPCPATEILSSNHFPDEMQGNLLVQNVIGFQGILNYKFEDKDASFTCKEVDPIMFSKSDKFRPVDLEVAPDGSLYFTDWANVIIGHLQHHIRDFNRDQTHGRVYRITCEGRPLSKSAKIAGAPITDLLELLKSDEDRVRYRTRIELGGRDTKEVLAAADKWLAGLDKNAQEYEHQRLEGLWLYQNHNVVNEKLLDAVLASPDFRARAAATHVLSYWSDRVQDPIAKLKKLCLDEHPRVRLEAIRACSFFKGEQGSEAAEAALASLDKPQDPYLSYMMKETMKTLKPYLKK